MESSEYSSDHIYDIGLVYPKLNLTLVGGIILISGLVMACAVEVKKNFSNPNHSPNIKNMKKLLLSLLALTLFSCVSDEGDTSSKLWPKIG